MKQAHEHLDYIDWLTDTRRWLAGAQLSLADFAAAAQISVADYLGGIDWAGHEQAHGWYRVMKSRPSFRPLLTEKMEGIPPAEPLRGCERVTGRGPCPADAFSRDMSR
jgi:glutathione S-transferase